VGRVYTGFGEGGQGDIGQSILTDTTDHVDPCAKPGRGDCLVETLATGAEQHLAGANGFSRARDLVGPQSDVDIHAAHDHDLVHRRNLDARL
jgi:hypothetical protein